MSQSASEIRWVDGIYTNPKIQVKINNLSGTIDITIDDFIMFIVKVLAQRHAH